MSVQAIPGTQIKAQAASPALTAEHLKQVDRIAGLNALVRRADPHLPMDPALLTELGRMQA